jgi:hypothetical protein
LGRIRLDGGARIVDPDVDARISGEEIQRVWRREESGDMVQQKKENTIPFTILVQVPSAFW